MERPTTSPRSPRPRAAAAAAAAAVAIVVLATACGSTETGRRSGAVPDRMAFGEAASPNSDPAASAAGSQTTTSTTTSTTTTLPPPSTSPPVPLGTPGAPFGPLPAGDRVTAVITPTGLALPVLGERSDGWLVATPCQRLDLITEATPVRRAHVVLDPGHGGAEPGATGPSGLRESDLNLLVATRAAELLREAGATVVLTRTGDHTMTAAARGHVAKVVEPALFVSIHHNGGAPPSTGGPGTIVFTKADSPASTRFGGLFHQTLQPMLIGAAEPLRAAYDEAAAVLDNHDVAVAHYDNAVAARDAALVANGQVPAEATTSIPQTTIVAPGELRVPATRVPATTTTLPATATEAIPVPPQPVPPTPPAIEPVRSFGWAGGPNAGVRSWVRPDGHDYLAVLRHSGDVPAVLAEFLYLTNPSEEQLLSDPAFIEREASVLADSIVLYFTTDGTGTGHVADQQGDQPIGGSGSRRTCVEPPLR